MGGCVFMWWVCIYGVGDIRDVYIWVSAGGTLVRACLVGEHMGMRIYGGGGGVSASNTATGLCWAVVMALCSPAGPVPAGDGG